MIPAPDQRPPKRTHGNADGSDPTVSSLPLSITPPQVKSERSPSPLIVEKRLVTSGSKRFAPIPNNCLPSHTEHRQHRLEWGARCAKELEALNLIPGRRLLRDDGLVIDWKSHVPVWSDTLKPDPQDLAATIVLAHRSNAQWRRPAIRRESPAKSVTATPARHRSSAPVSGDVSDAESPSKKKLPVPPRPSSIRRNKRSQSISVNSPPSRPSSPSPCSKRPRFTGETERETGTLSHDRIPSLSDRVPVSSDISSQHGPINIPPKPRNRARDQSIAPGTSSAAEDEMSEMTLNYLRR
ncbi:hypothetical protein HD554DRAFT_2082478 [Boletus coccyginus]|nr:hypothetical protein HD554DRAFT_2082478 [Boletus coccyginus]